MPDEPEALGLLALMLLQDSRRAARTGPGRRARAPRRPGSVAAGTADGSTRASASCGGPSRCGGRGRISFRRPSPPGTPRAPTPRRSPAVYELLERVDPSPVVAAEPRGGDCACGRRRRGSRSARCDRRARAGTATSTPPAPTSCGASDEATRLLRSTRGRSSSRTTRPSASSSKVACRSSRPRGLRAPPRPPPPASRRGARRAPGAALERRRPACRAGARTRSRPACRSCRRSRSPHGPRPRRRGSCAWPIPVTTTWSAHGFASACDSPGRIARVLPPASFAPRWAAAITSPRPPVTTVQPRSASRRPTSAAAASCPAPLPTTDT